MIEVRRRNSTNMFTKKTIWKIQKVLLIAAAIIVVLYGINRVMLYRAYDKSGPEITFDKELLKVSVKSSEKKLLKGVKAEDKKDGDVTDSIIIESISKMQENNERFVTYVAFDSDNNVTKAERRIRYTDYTGPRFSLEAPLGASSLSASTSELFAPLKAKDSVDGDISNQIVIVSTDISGMSSDEAMLVFEVQVTNSSGDIASLKLPVKMVAGGSNGIELKDYLIYTKVNKRVNLENNIKGNSEGVKIDADIDYSEPGTYVVTYSIDMGSVKRETPLYVVVEK